MADGKKSFLLYCDIIHMVSKMPDEMAGRLFKHILEYVNDMNPKTDDLLIELSFEPIKQSLKRDLEKWESIRNRNRTNGLNGGRPKTQQTPEKPSGLLENPDEPKKPDSVSVSVSDIEEPIVVDYNFVLESYHSFCNNLPKVLKLSYERKKHVNARVREFGIDTVVDVFKKTGSSSFLNGNNDKKWKADFDWIFNPNNFLKILEGKYTKTKQSKEEWIRGELK